MQRWDRGPCRRGHRQHSGTTATPPGRRRCHRRYISTTTTTASSPCTPPPPPTGTPPTLTLNLTTITELALFVPLKAGPSHTVFRPATRSRSGLLSSGCPRGCPRVGTISGTHFVFSGLPEFRRYSSNYMTDLGYSAGQLSSYPAQGGMAAPNGLLPMYHLHHHQSPGMGVPASFFPPGSAATGAVATIPTIVSKPAAIPPPSAGQKQLLLVLVAIRITVPTTVDAVKKATWVGGAVEKGSRQYVREPCRPSGFRGRVSGDLLWPGVRVGERYIEAEWSLHDRVDIGLIGSIRSCQH
ncbi:hypothetical protein BHE74_00006264 [Ensete ventricosum]|nr:hypothetical protein BHE74_00006264 [Ensete ventricosum]RZR88040.1 hypothetical protein BHM03_00015532 [Ensete ventricosum]